MKMHIREIVFHSPVSISDRHTHVLVIQKYDLKYDNKTKHVFDNKTK